MGFSLAAGWLRGAAEGVGGEDDGPESSGAIGVQELIECIEAFEMECMDGVGSFRWSVRPLVWKEEMLAVSASPYIF